MYKDPLTFSFVTFIIITNEKHHGMRGKNIHFGGLLPGLSTNDFMAGIFQPRNPKLAQDFFRLNILKHTAQVFAEYMLSIVIPI